jgi:hypothetical protein
MSALRVLWPSEDVADLEADEPDVVPLRRQPLTVIDRARALYSNRRCPVCSYPVIVPIELNDAAINRSGLPIPGTATLVGFHCCGCHAEWAV